MNYQDIKFKDTTLPLAVVVTSTPWHEPPRIRHQLTRQLTRFYNVLYIEKNLKNRNDHIEQIHERQIVYSPGMACNIPLRLNANEPLTHHLVNSYFKRKIIAFAKQFNPGQMFLVNFVYDFFEIMRSGVFDYKIHVCYDEFPKMRRRKEKPNFIKKIYQQRLFQNYENHTVRKADICLVTHKVLIKKLYRYNNKCIQFLPGHEFKCINKIHTKNIKKKINIGFMGFINWRLQFDWLNRLVNEPDMQLTLIGPFEKETPNIFTNYKKIVHFNFLKDGQLFDELNKCDVFIMPFDPEIPEVEILTINNKIYQYLASGKPVVISNLPNYIQLGEGIIYKATSSSDFINKIRQAYNEDCQEYVDLRLKIAAENTWDKRGDELYKIITTAISEN